MKFRITDNWDFIISDDQGEREEILTSTEFYRMYPEIHDALVRAKFHRLKKLHAPPTPDLNPFA